MLRRGGAVVQPIHRAGFAAVGATWEPVEDVLHRNKGLVLTHGRAAPVELRRYVCRAKTLHSLSGRKQTQETPHYACALDMLQVCDDARAGAVLNDFAQIYVFSPTSTKQGTLYTLMVNTPAAADFLLTHAAKPDRGNGSLRFVHGAAGYLAMAKLLPFIFALPVAASRTKSRFSVEDGLRLHCWA